MFKFELGQEVMDKITGFQGIIMAQVKYLTGCTQYGICSQFLDKDGGIPKWEYLDEDRLGLSEKKVGGMGVIGGPQQTPSKR